MLADPVVSLKCISTIDIDYPSISTTISQEETASEPFDLCQQRVSWHGTSYPDTVSKNQCSLKQEVSSAQNTCWLTIIWGQFNSYRGFSQFMGNPISQCEFAKLQMFDSGLRSIRTSEVSKSPGENAQELQNLRKGTSYPRSFLIIAVQILLVHQIPLGFPLHPYCWWLNPMEYRFPLGIIMFPLGPDLGIQPSTIRNGIWGYSDVPW